MARGKRTCISIAVVETCPISDLFKNPMWQEDGKTFCSQHVRLRWLARARDGDAKSLVAMSFLPLETLEENVTREKKSF